MFAARILYPVEVLGPGKRIGIWVAGCSRRCADCCNPDLWYAHERFNISVEKMNFLINSLAQRNHIDGLTITGGEPFEQAEEIAELLTVNKVTDDILIYTGYNISELVLPQHKKLLEKTAVLIDGQYINELNDNSFLRGSSNQQIHILNDTYRAKYTKYITCGTNKIQNFMIGNEIVSVGIHKKGK